MSEGTARDFSEVEETDWAARCSHWTAAVPTKGRKRGRRERNSEPLILTGQGVSLRVDNGALLIRDGFTHYPQTRKTYRFFKGDPGLPPRILLLDGSGSISFDVLSWLSEQSIPLIRISWNGEVICVIGGSGFSADREKVQWQRDTRAHPLRQMEFSTDLVRRKIDNGISTLRSAISPAPQREAAIRKSEEALRQLARATPKDVPSLRAIEAQCAGAYFGGWKGLQISWKGTSRRLVPDDWQTFTSRTSLANGHKLKNVNASHPVNAMLNYAYTVLQSDLQIKTIADGYDPTIGIMHEGRRKSPAFVFDLMEPERPNIDRAVLKFVQTTTFHPGDFVITPAGTCRLNPGLSRHLGYELTRLYG